jgi:hypothetical protein
MVPKASTSIGRFAWWAGESKSRYFLFPLNHDEYDASEDFDLVCSMPIHAVDAWRRED